MKKHESAAPTGLPYPETGNFGRRASDHEKTEEGVWNDVPEASEKSTYVNGGGTEEGMADPGSDIAERGRKPDEGNRDMRHRATDGNIGPIERELIRELRDIGTSLKKLDETLNLIKEHEFIELHSSKWKIFAYQIFLWILFAIGTVLGLVLLSWTTYTFFKDSTVLRGIVDSQLQMRRFNLDQIKEKAMKDAESSPFLNNGKPENAGTPASAQKKPAVQNSAGTQKPKPETNSKVPETKDASASDAADGPSSSSPAPEAGSLSGTSSGNTSDSGSQMRTDPSRADGT